jgi:hypothetical protein
MRKLVFLAALPALLFPMMAAAQSGFDGTWKDDPKTMNPSEKPDEFLLMDGMYECKTCVPPYNVKADGTDQPISGNPYVDTVAIKVVNDHEVEETDKKGDKVVATSTVTVAPDGKTVSITFSDSSDTNGGPPVTGKAEAKQVAKGPAGSHAVSGSWRMSKMESVSDNGIVWTYKVNGDQITMTTPTGQTYTAKLDGTDAPMMGDPGVSSVSVMMNGKDTLVETDKRDGKVIGVMTMTLDGAGKTAKISYDDKLQNRTNQVQAIKQ